MNTVRKQPSDELVRQFINEHPEGATVQAIASALGENHHTVRFELERIFKKLRESRLAHC